MAAGPSPFPAAEKDQNAAAASAASKGRIKALPVITAPAKAEKKVNGDFVRRPKLMNSSVIIGRNIAVLRLVNFLELIINPIGLHLYYCT
jgi:hypothetical protein